MAAIHMTLKRQAAEHVLCPNLLMQTLRLVLGQRQDDARARGEPVEATMASGSGGGWRGRRTELWVQPGIPRTTQHVGDHRRRQGGTLEIGFARGFRPGSNL